MHIFILIKEVDPQDRDQSRKEVLQLLLLLIISVGSVPVW